MPAERPPARSRQGLVELLLAAAFLALAAAGALAVFGEELRAALHGDPAPAPAARPARAGPGAPPPP
jgi:hypothetical protein